MTIHAAKLAAPEKLLPYYKRRIAELIEQGRAAIREPGRHDAAKVRIEKAANRLSWKFAERLALMQDVRVYYSAANATLAFRRQNPRPALNGKVFVPKLPADAEFVGRYSYPFSRRQFVRDLLETMGGSASTPDCAANLSANPSPTIHVRTVRPRTQCASARRTK